MSLLCRADLETVFKCRLHPIFPAVTPKSPNYRLISNGGCSVGPDGHIGDGISRDRQDCQRRCDNLSRQTARSEKAFAIGCPRALVQVYVRRQNNSFSPRRLSPFVYRNVARSRELRSGSRSRYGVLRQYRFRLQTLRLRCHPRYLYTPPGKCSHRNERRREAQRQKKNQNPSFHFHSSQVFFRPLTASTGGGRIKGTP